MASLSIKLPIREKALITSIKFPIHEKAWDLVGFVIGESIVSLREQSTVLLENIKSRILVNAELVDKSHIKLVWFGEKVPKILIYQRLDGEDYQTTPTHTLDWSPQEYILTVDNNAYYIKLKGLNNTGESNELNIGANQEYPITPVFQLPVNEKYYFMDLNLTTEYRIEVSL